MNYLNDFLFAWVLQRVTLELGAEDIVVANWTSCALTKSPGDCQGLI